MEKEKHVVNNGGAVDSYKVKLMCSYGGKIHTRGAQLVYVGGDTKILTVDRNIRFKNLIAKLHSLCDLNFPFCLKYQLPGYDLDALVSVIDAVDLENMMFEYDCIHHRITSSAAAKPPSRFRIFVIVSSDAKPPATPDFLFGFDKEYTTVAAGSASPNQAAAAAAAASTAAPNPEASKNPDAVSAENVDPDPRDGAEITNTNQQVIQGIETVMLPPDAAYSRDNNVTPAGGYSYGAAAPLPQLFYRIPVPAPGPINGGYYQIGPYGGMHRLVGSREQQQQPVYTFVPVYPPPVGHEQVISPTDSQLAPSKQSEGFVAAVAGGGGGGGGGSMTVTVTSAAAAAAVTSNHETKVSPTGVA